MNCLEFKRLALSDPKSKDHSFIKHAGDCPDCLNYVQGIKEMDNQLAESVNIGVPEDLLAKLELGALLESEASNDNNKLFYYAKVAGFAAILFVSGFLLNGQLSKNESSQSVVAQGHVDHSYITDNVQAGTSFVNAQSADSPHEYVMQMVNHMELIPINPIWESDKANKAMKVLMASYDQSVSVKTLPNLQFIKICPMTPVTRAIHANLETDHGQVTFAYFKGNSVGELSDTSYKGYLTRIKPVHGGSLLIISRNMDSMEIADRELEAAIYWDI